RARRLPHRGAGRPARPRTDREPVLARGHRPSVTSRQNCGRARWFVPPGAVAPRRRVVLPRLMRSDRRLVSVGSLPFLLAACSTLVARVAAAELTLTLDPLHTHDSLHFEGVVGVLGDSHGLNTASCYEATIEWGDGASQQAAIYELDS